MSPQSAKAILRVQNYGAIRSHDGNVFSSGALAWGAMRARYVDAARTAAPRVVNVVLASRLSVRIPLDAMSLTSEDSVYNPETFSGLIYRMRDRKVTVNAFSSGKVVAVGATSVTSARESLNSFRAVVSRVLGRSVRWSEPFKVVNVVATIDLGSRIDLRRFLIRFPGATYNPESFPAAVLRSVRGHVLLVYSTGQVVVAGARSVSEARAALRSVSKSVS